MPTNQIEVQWTEAGGYDVKVWDANGVETNVTSVFTSIGGSTGEGRVWTEVRCAADSLVSKVSFKALGKELKFTVKPAVIGQILQVLEASP